MRKHGNEAFNSFRLHHSFPASITSQMPGFAGIVGPSDSAPVAERVEAMSRTLRSSAGLASDVASLGSAKTSALGWAAHPKSLLSASPIANEANTLQLFFNGEIFADSAPGCPDSAKSGIWLLEQFEKLGSRALLALNGWFSGVIFDHEQHETYIFTDRFGLGRVYYSVQPDGFYFASEAKAILSAIPATRSLDLQGLGEWLSCGCVLQNRTLFNGISILPQASIWKINAHGVSRHSYFAHSEWTGQPKLSPEAYTDLLVETFPKVAARYFRSEQKLGMSLTGGLDGRMIMAWSPAEAATLPCYTFNGPYRDCADVKLARRIAAACAQPHTTIQVQDDFFTDFPSLARQTVHLSDGTMDVSGAAELYVNRHARSIAPIRLTGNYGSETVRSNVAFRAAPLNRQMWSPELATQGERALETYRTERKGSDLEFVVAKQVPWHHQSRLSLEQSQLTLRSPFLDSDLLSVVFQAPPQSAADLYPSLRLIHSGNPSLARIPTDRGIEYSSRPAIQRLKKRYHDFWAKAEYAYDYGMPPALARVDAVLKPFHLERIFLGRQKFCHYRVWYRDRLAPFLRETLGASNSNLGAIANGKRIASALEAHLAGRENHTVLLHKLLSLQLIHETLLK